MTAGKEVNEAACHYKEKRKRKWKITQREKGESVIRGKKRIFNHYC